MTGGSTAIMGFFPDGRLACASGVLVLLLLVTVTAALHHMHLLFALHVLCMSSAFLLAMGQGIAAYMQRGVPREVARPMHQRWQVLTLVLAAVGLVTLIAHKAEAGKPLLSFSLHASAGWVCLLLLAGQGLVGRVKVALLSEGLRRYPWHGLAGWGVFALGSIVIALGVLAAAKEPLLPLAALALLFLHFAWVGFAMRRFKQGGGDTAPYQPVSTADTPPVDVEMPSTAEQAVPTPP